MEKCHIFRLLVNIALLAKNCDKGLHKNDCENLSFSVFGDTHSSLLNSCILSMTNLTNQISISNIMNVINEPMPTLTFTGNDFDASGIVAIFIPTSQSQFFHIVQKLATSTPPGHRSWRPLQIHYFPVNLHIKDKSSCSQRSRQNFLQTLLASKHFPWLSQIMLSDEILFTFEMKCGTTKEWSIWSTWEIYAYTHSSDHNDTHRQIDHKHTLGETWQGDDITSLIGMNEVVKLNMTMTDRGNSFQVQTPPPILRRRSNFNQAIVKAVAPKLNPLEAAWITDKATGETRFIGGMSVNILKDFQTILNFSLQILPGDYFITNSQSNTNLSALRPVTGDLLRLRQVEIMIGQTTPLPSRQQSVDILLPTSYNRLLVYIHQPTPSSAREIFADPLQPSLWLAFGVSWVVLLICIRISIDVYRKANANSSNFTDEEFSSDPYFWSFATISIHGWSTHPKRRSLRIIFFLGTFITGICYNAFSAELMSVLSLKVIPIPDLPTLFRSSIPIHAALESSNIAEIIKGLQLEGKIKSFPSPFIPGLKGVPNVFQAPMAFIAYDHVFHLIRAHHKISDVDFCASLTSFPLVKLTTTAATAMSMPKNSPLRETFNHKIMLLKERGLLSRHQNIFHRDGGAQCLPRDQGPTETPLALHDLATATLIFLGGALLCLLILIAERAYYYPNLQNIRETSSSETSHYNLKTDSKRKRMHKRKRSISKVIQPNEAFHFQP